MIESYDKPRIGEDGYQYFTYGLNAVFEVETQQGVVRYQIIGMQWSESGEYQTYTVEVLTGELRQLRELSLDRLNYLLTATGTATELSPGDPQELPLTRTEVELYYEKEVKARGKRKREANAKLKEHKEYKSIISEEKELLPRCTEAFARCAENGSELEARIYELAARKRAILSELGISPADLASPEPCEECNGKGVTGHGWICACAHAQNEAIKAYSAAERRLARLKI